MYNINHPNYSVRSGNGKTIIDYKKTPREWGHFIFSVAFGVVLVYCPLYLIYTGKHVGWQANTILVIAFFILIMFYGILRLCTALEILFRPTTALITIDPDKKTIKARLVFFRQTIIPFEHIRTIQLSGDDATVRSYHRGRTHKRRLYAHLLQFQLQDGTTRKIHRFLSRRFFIPVLPQNETYEVNSIGKQIAKLIAAETGIHYKWLGTKKHD